MAYLSDIIQGNENGREFMKTQYALIGILITSVAHSADFGIYANSVSAHNIATAQHEIANRVFVPMGKTSVVKSATTRTKPAVTNDDQDPDAYGEMLYYGEFGDDTGVLPLVTGRSGGENSDESFRIGWQHFSDNVKFKSYPHLKSTSDLAFIAYGNEFNATRMEFFGGYSGAHTRNESMDMDTDGAFIGASFGKKIGKLELAAMADFGLAVNDVKSVIYSDDFNNFYAGIMANAAYEFDYDDDILFRPAFRAGYTWIDSASYISSGGENITNQDFGFFELSPMLDVLGNVGDGLSIGAHVGYIMNFRTGGKVDLNYAAVPKLDINNHFEYGIVLSQNFEGFSLNMNIGRHDGARNGWNGGAEFRYVF